MIEFTSILLLWIFKPQIPEVIITSELLVLRISGNVLEVWGYTCTVTGQPLHLDPA